MVYTIYRTSFMNKTIVALQLASLSSPLFTPVHSNLAFSLRFNNLKLHHFFSSFIYSNGCQGSIKVSRSDFGFFLDTVINIDAATHNIIGQDLTRPYNTGDSYSDMSGWVTCPSLDCFNSIFHDIVIVDKGSGGIAYQGKCEGDIRDTTFINISASGACFAGALAANELDPRTNPGSSHVSRCCFSKCSNVNNEGTGNYHTFRLGSFTFVEVSLTSVYNCGTPKGNYVCSVQSCGDRTVKVTTLNSSFNKIDGYGCGIAYFINKEGERNSELTLSTFMHNEGNVVYSKRISVPGSSSTMPSNHQHYILISQCNFISNYYPESLISTVNGNADGEFVYQNFPTLNKNVFINLTGGSNAEFMDFGGYPGTVVMTDCIGDAERLSFYPPFNYDASMYRRVSSPATIIHEYLNTKGCMAIMNNPPIVKTTVNPPMPPSVNTYVNLPHTPVVQTSPQQVNPPNPDDDGAQGGNKSNKPSSISGGAITGIVIGIVAASAVIGAVAFIVIKKPCQRIEDSDDGITV